MSVSSPLSFGYINNIYKIKVSDMGGNQDSKKVTLSLHRPVTGPEGSRSLKLSNFEATGT